MSGASKQRSQKERIESLGIQKPRLVEWWQRSDKSDGAIRIAMAVVAAAAMLFACQTWQPAFSYRTGEIPERDLITRVTFDVIDVQKTNLAKEKLASEQIAFYKNRSEPLNQLRAALRNQLFQVLDAPAFDQLSDDELESFSEFYKPEASDEPDAKPADAPADRFALFKKVLANEEGPSKVDTALGTALSENYKYGLFQGLQHNPRQGNQELIRVYPSGQPDDILFVELSNAQIAQAKEGIRTRLREQFRTQFPDAEDDEYSKVSQMVYDWLVTRLPDFETLTYDDIRSEQARQEATSKIQPEKTTYKAGNANLPLAQAGIPLDEETRALLRREWEGIVSQLTWTDMLARVLAYAGMIAALYLLCGAYIFFVDDRRLLLDRWKFAKLLTLMVGAVTLSYFASRDQWRGELIPLVLASIIAAVVYGRELALLLMAAASISVTLFLGANLAELVMMAAACTSCTLLLGRIRSRTHLLYVGAISAAITILTVVGVGIVTSGAILSSGVAMASPDPSYHGPQFDLVIVGLIRQAFWSGFLILVSATFMTGILPWVEKAYGVQTDLSLLELGDASHPLLRRLAQRAPGTYNHSINVASIAEAAADAIGANGLLVRVGAYFHDIGKMFKPEYFVENQSAGVNQHDSLQPAMSTLVIIAHVKDGADLARSHHLPPPIIDFILQHHGTTLVEYFYREAARRSEEDPNGESVSDKDFRYPGPKPQTLEAAVMMLADAVESASRTLVDPTPARIKGLVDSIAQKKMSDGQFDECGLTFRQLDRVRQSLVKSLTAIYHARVKYPGQQSA